MPFMQIPKTFSTFPVEGKKPLVSWGAYSKRLPRPDELADWKHEYPNSQRGIATGEVSGVIVLDDDIGLDTEQYPIPLTWSVKTPRGGSHYYFKWTSDLSSKVTTKTDIFNLKKEHGVDVRGAGGFAVFYGWKKPTYILPLASPPQWLIDLLPNKYTNHITLDKTTEISIEKSNLMEIIDGIHPGNRNESFTRWAGSLRARGYNASDLFGTMSSKAREVEFPELELKTICESVARYEPNIRIDESQASSIEDFLKDQEKVEWICEGLIAKKSIGFIVGLPETGKTWAMIDLAIQCAKGDGLWLNKFPVKKQKVLFIDQERFKGETQRRLKAVIASQTVQSNALNNALFVKSGTTIRLNLQHSFDAFRKELGELKPDLVIVDSFATFHLAEENNRKDIQVVLERVKKLRNEFGCTFLFISHENKFAFDKEGGEPSIAQMAGSIAIPAAAETVFTVRKQDSESSMIYHTKSTLSSTHEPFLIKVIDQNEQKTSIKVEAF